MKRLVILLASISFTLYGCKKAGVQTISWGEPKIEAEIVRVSVDGAFENHASVEVWGTELIPVVVVNNETLEVIDENLNNDYTYYTKFWKIVPGNVLNEMELTVYHTGGTATSSAYLPNDYAIKVDDPLLRNNDLKIHWGIVDSANYYELTIKLQYEYNSGIGPTQTFKFDTSVITEDTSFTGSASRLFGDLTSDDEIKSGDCTIKLYAINGLYPGRSLEGNIVGKGEGYFYAKNYRETKISVSE